MMSEALLETQQDQITLEPGTAKEYGHTVFEALAVGAEGAIEQPDGSGDVRINNSLTRLPDGQTVPDDR